MNKSYNQNDYFFKFHKAFFFCTSVLNKLTGEEFKATSSMFEIYTYMLDQYLSYISKGSTFYENQLDICKKLRGMNPKTFRSNYKKLQDLGLVSHTERSSSCGKYKSHEYTVKTPEEAEDHLVFSYSFDFEKEHQTVKVTPDVNKKSKPEQPKEGEAQTNNSSGVFNPFEQAIDEKLEATDFLAELEAYDALQSPGKPKIQPELVKPKMQPWGSSAIFKGNGCVNDEAWQWASTNSNGTEEDALKVLSKQTGLKIERNQIQSYSQSEDEEYNLPF